MTPSVELRVQLDPGDDITSVSHQRTAWELARTLSEKAGVYRVTITESPRPGFRDGEVFR